jgi:hypothetical protein
MYCVKIGRIVSKLTAILYHNIGRPALGYLGKKLGPTQN